MTQDQPDSTPAADAEMPRPAEPAGGRSEEAAEPTPSYEEARDELVAVVQRLETGGVPLQESVALWERGEQLAMICQRWLDGARARLDAAIDRS